jgi:Iap family predicted aminopeptidase
MRLAIVLCLATLACWGASVEVHYKLTARDVVADRVHAALKDNVARGDQLRAMLEGAGCPAGRLELQAVKHAKAPNAICTVPGETGQTIVVGAHFDHVAAGLGVIDNWSGAALLPSLLESTRSAPRRHTFVFAGFTGEEDGLLGSKHYVGHLAPEDLKRIVAMINFDSVGAGPTEVQVKTADKNLLTRLLNTANSIHVPVRRMDFESIGTSDYASFMEKHLPTLVLHSLTPQTLHILHSADDNMKALHMDDYYDTYRLLALYLALLDVTLDAPDGQR